MCLPEVVRFHPSPLNNQTMKNRKELKMWYVYKNDKFLGYIHAKSESYAEQLAENVFGFNVKVKKVRD